MQSPDDSILIVEDDPSLRLLCRVNLELEGYRVREAASVDEARRELAAARPLMVFLDVHLGRHSSDEVLDELKAAGIPVVLVTGTADVADYRDRATEVLSKPYAPEDLIAAAKRLAVG
jgi:DNA-binding NtrC family response regulator